MFEALKRGRFRSLASLILVVNVVGELHRKRIAASRGFLATARLSCYTSDPCYVIINEMSLRNGCRMRRLEVALAWRLCRMDLHTPVI